MPEPESGHGALVAVTLAPVASPNVFTTIAQLTSNLDVKSTRDSSDITPHNETNQRMLVSNIRKWDVISIEGNYIHGDTTHDGVRDLYIANTMVGVQLTGPSGASTDRYIMSGQFVTWQVMNPKGGANVRSFKADFQPYGAMRIDGTLIS
jgi:predicted secreted protein